MTDQLTDAELTFLSEWRRCDEDGMEYYHRAIAELRELRGENAKLRAALEGVVRAIDAHHPKFKYGPFALTRAEIDAAREALASVKGGQG